MSYSCELVERAAQPALSVRTRSSVQNLPQALGQAYGAVMAALAQTGEQPAGPPFVAYYNMDMQDLDIEAGFPVARALPGAGNVQAGEIPAGKAATCLHVGPYPEIRAAYETLQAWMAQHGYQPGGVVYEIYLNDPQTTTPQALQTQIVFPLQGA